MHNAPQRGKFYLDPLQYLRTSRSVEMLNSRAGLQLLELQRCRVNVRQYRRICDEIEEIANAMVYVLGICERLTDTAGEGPRDVIFKVIVPHPGCKRELAEDEPEDSLPRTQVDVVWKDRVDALLDLAGKTENYMLEHAVSSKQLRFSTRCLKKITAALERQRRHLLTVGAGESNVQFIVESCPDDTGPPPECDDEPEDIDTVYM